MISPQAPISLSGVEKDFARSFPLKAGLGRKRCFGDGIAYSINDNTVTYTQQRIMPVGPEKYATDFQTFITFN